MVHYSSWFPVLHVKENGNSPLKSCCSFSFCVSGACSVKNIWWTEWKTSMQLNQSAVTLKLLFEKRRWVDAQPMKQIFIFIYHSMILTECKANFYCFVGCHSLQKGCLPSYFDAYLLNWSLSRSLAVESKTYCHCLIKLIINSIPATHLFYIADIF